VDKDAPTYDNIVTSYAGALKKPGALKNSEEQKMKAKVANADTTALLAASGGMKNLLSPAIKATPYSEAAENVKGCAVVN
jgi:hypothetical protein